MEDWQQMDRPLRDLIDIIQFTENVAARIHGLLGEAEICTTVREEFAKSDRYTMSIALLTDDGSKLRIVETSLPPGLLQAAERAAGRRLGDYRIDLNKSTTYCQVVREGRTVQVNVADIIGELLPRSLASLILKILSYEQKSSIVTPLRRHGRIAGIFAMSTTELARYFIPSVRNLAQHISTALDLADQYAERSRVEGELRRAHDELEARVKGRTAELTVSHDHLRQEMAQRRRVEEALRESEQKYRTLVEHSLQGSLVVQDLRIVFANSAFAEMSGYTVEELLALSPENVKALVHPDDQTLVWGRFQDRLAGKQVPSRYQYRGVRKNGRAHWLEMAAGRIEYGGRPAVQGAIIDITERRRAEEVIAQRERDLRRLSVELISAQEAERRRISRELHDEMGQALTAMSINLSAVEEALPPECSPMIKERLTETGWLAERLLAQMRDLSHELRPTLLDDLGLLPALRWYVDRYTRRLKTEVEFEAIGFQDRLTAELETALYRVVQEALTNVARHAQASRVRIRLEHRGTTVTASIEDDGQGFNIEECSGRAASERGTGLIGMRERVTSLRGSFSIKSQPGEGTRLSLEIPVRP
jgi:PAS domain S-box-containing protein